MSSLARFETSCEAYVAGIPVAPALTAAGQRLRGCLRECPHEFVQTALRELRVRSALCWLPCAQAHSLARASRAPP